MIKMRHLIGLRRICNDYLKYTLLLCLLISSVRFSYAQTTSACKQIDAAFKQAAEPHEREACRCFIDTTSPSPSQDLKHPSLSDNHSDKIWIGCTRQKMPQVFSALNALNETLISKLYIWDSLINIIPADMFAQVRPRQLSIEHSGVSVFRAGAFSNIGQRLKILQLRNNIIKRIEPVIVEDLHRLQVLDLGANKIAQVTKGQVDKLKDLETLILSDNQISYIEDDAFQTLTNLKTLSLADNKLTDISKNTFRGLNNLETLNLHGNTITTVDWSAFAHMKNLKLLDIGNNQITNVELHGLQSLEKLFINNNSIQTLKNISLRDLVNLNVLSLDRNSITQIQDGDLHSLAESVRLNSLSIAANKINKIESRALEPIHQLKILSLENNQLKSLSADDGIGNVSFLRPLRKLKTLLLSSNNIKQIDENDLASLVSLKTLALDHNEIEKIDSKALLRLPLTRIYLNHNRLFYLSKGTFDSLSTSSLDVVDISDNVWQCICKNVWLSKWLSEVGDKNVADGSLGCIATKKMCNGDDSDDNIESEDEEHSVWITVIASILAVVSLFILIAIAFLYVEDGKRLDRITTPLRRVPSDLLRLIPDGDSIISLPSESIVEPFITSQLPPPKRSIITNHRNNASNNPLIITTHNDNSNQLSTINTNDTNDSNNNNNNNGKTIEKKRVRFNGI